MTENSCQYAYAMFRLLKKKKISVHCQKMLENTAVNEVMKSIKIPADLLKDTNLLTDFASHNTNKITIKKCFLVDYSELWISKAPKAEGERDYHGMI